MPTCAFGGRGMALCMPSTSLILGGMIYDAVRSFQKFGLVCCLDAAGAVFARHSLEITGKSYLLFVFYEVFDSFGPVATPDQCSGREGRKPDVTAIIMFAVASGIWHCISYRECTIRI